MMKTKIADLKRLQKRGIEIIGLDEVPADPFRPSKEQLKVLPGKEAVEIHRRCETGLAIACFEFFGYLYPQYYRRFFHIANECLSGDVKELKKRAAMGVLPGAWDYFLSVPRGTFHGLYLDMKSISGILSDDQLLFMKANQDDYAFGVPRSTYDFEKIIQNYFSLKDFNYEKTKLPQTLVL